MVDRARERSNTKDGNHVRVTGFSKNADVAKLADAQVSGSCGQPCGFESLHPHQKIGDTLLGVAYFSLQITMKGFEGGSRERE